MRYHTFPLISFACFLERKGHDKNTPRAYFERGSQFQCFLSNMTVTKVNAVENVVTVYRNYTLKFVFNYNRYSFTLDPGGTILRHQVRGDIIVDDPGLYRLERFGNYQEAHVNFRLDITGGNITGNYYNWHGERGEFEGRVGTDVATLTAKGHHFRGVRYRKATESQRRTEWTAITPLHYPTVNGLSPSW